MKGYKAFKKDLTCLGFQYEIGKEYIIDDEPIMCERGFHFCETIADTYSFYPIKKETRICKIEAFGDIIYDHKNRKYCTNKIRIIKEITNKAKKMCNINNTSYGYFNTGSYNDGKSNTGRCNVGRYNSNNYNMGHRNSGCNNIGYFNSGNNNIGDRNVGDNNRGSYNSGDWNLGNYHCGCFNTKNEKIKFFNKESDWTYNTWYASQAYGIITNIPLIETTKWVSDKDMTDKEKEMYPSYKITGGYLKKDISEEAPQNYWDNLSGIEKQYIYDLPNFDAEIFKECTGIDINKSKELL